MNYRKDDEKTAKLLEYRKNQAASLTESVRKQNLMAHFEKNPRGERVVLAHRLGVTRSRISRLLSPEAPFSESMARRIEQIYGWPYMSLDTGNILEATTPGRRLTEVEVDQLSKKIHRLIGTGDGALFNRVYQKAYATLAGTPGNAPAYAVDKAVDMAIVNTLRETARQQVSN